MDEFLGWVARRAQARDPHWRESEKAVEQDMSDADRHLTDVEAEIDASYRTG